MKTYADMAELLAKKKSKYEKLIDSTSSFERNTGERMLKRADRINAMLIESQQEVSPEPDPEQFDLGGFFTKNKNLLFDIGSNLLDAGIRQAGINSMKAPSKPAYMPRVSLDKTVDVSPEVNAIERNRVLQSRSADRNLRDSRVAESVKSSAFSNSIDQLGKVYGAARREKSAISRQQAGYDYQTGMVNTNIANQHEMMLNDFENNKRSATINNWTGALTNFRLDQKDRLGNALDKFKFLVTSRQFGDSGTWDRLMEDPEIKSMYETLFPQ